MRLEGSGPPCHKRLAFPSKLPRRGPVISKRRFDVTEDVAYFAIFVHTYRQIDVPTEREVLAQALFSSDATVSPFGGSSPSGGSSSLLCAQTLVFALALLWCARLLGFLGFRIVMRGRCDRRDHLTTVMPLPPRHNADHGAGVIIPRP